MKKTLLATVSGALVATAFSNMALAADVSQDAIDACIDTVRAQNGGQGGIVLSTEFSEANSLVTLQDASGTVWRCLVSNDGRTASAEMSDADPVHAHARPDYPDYADGMSGGPDFWRVNVHSMLNVHSAPSTTAPTVARLHRGMVVENRGCQFNEGRKWCEVADGDASGWVAGEYLVEAAGPAPAVSHEARAEPTTQTVRIQFAAGASGQQRTGTLTPGSSVRFVLGAANQQMLEVSFVNTDPDISYQIFLPNGRLLLDQVSSRLPYQGQLFMSGDHVVEVINRSHDDARYAVYMGIY